MAPSRRAARAAAVAVGVVVALVAVVSVVTARQSTGLNERDLVLHGRAPTSASASLTVDIGSEEVTGHLTVDFVSGAIAGTIDIPEVISTEVVSFVVDPGTLFVSVPNLISDTRVPWVAIPSTLTHAGLAGVAHELATTQSALTHPSRALGTETVSRSGSFITDHFANAHAHVVESVTVPVRLPSTVALTTAITVGDEGQFAAGAASISAPGVDYSASISMESYDHAVSIADPAPALVAPITPALRQRIFGSDGGWLNRLLTASGLASLFTIRLT